jgi:hypothetical protein
MQNQLTKIALLCACVLAGTSPATGQKGGKIGASYNPPIKIATTPESFPVGGKISITGSVFNKTNSPPNAPGLRLRVVAADNHGNWPATGGATYDYAPIGTQNWAHWSDATFDNVVVPSVSAGQTLAVIAHYVEWSAALHKYLEPGGAVNEGAAIFKRRCIPINNKAICRWSKQ